MSVNYLNKMVLIRRHTTKSSISQLVAILLFVYLLMIIISSQPVFALTIMPTPQPASTSSDGDWVNGNVGGNSIWNMPDGNPYPDASYGIYSVTISNSVSLTDYPEFINGISVNSTTIDFGGSLGISTTNSANPTLLTSSGAMTVGLTGTGTVTQSSGTVSAGSLSLGVVNGSNGIYNLLGGTLNDDAIVGDAGSGTFTNTGSTHNVSGNLILGNQSTGNGTYTITGNGAQTTISFVPGGNGAGNPNGALIVGNAGTGSFTQGLLNGSDNPTVSVAGDLVLGHQIGSTGTYVLNSGNLTVGGQLAVGGQSTNNNVFTQNGGTLTLTNTASASPDYVNVGDSGFNPWGGALAVGGGIGNGDNSNSGGNGAYNMNGGVISTYNLLVGPTGTGIMTQTGGQVNTTFFTLGFSGTGTYNLQGDSTSTLNAYSEVVGYAGTGIFNQSGGVNTVQTSLEVGYQYPGNSPGSGAYTMTGGTLNTGNTTVGDGEVGTFAISDAAAPANHNVSGNLILGNQSTGNGSYTITGNATTTISFVPGGNPSGPINGDGVPINGALIVGNVGTGSFVQGLVNGSDNPTVSVAGDLVIGHLGTGAGLTQDSIGTYTINSGSLTVGGNIGVGTASTANDGATNPNIGGNANPLNIFTQNGGTVTITGSASGNSDYAGVGTSDHTGELFIGGGAGVNNDNGSGAYIMNGGTLTSQGIEVGHTGLGVMTQNGALSVVNTDYLWLGNAGGSNGYYFLNNGQINTGSETIGLGGTGTFTQTGGANAVSGAVSVAGGAGSDSYSLSGGTLTAGAVYVGDGTMGTLDPSQFFNTGANGTLNISGASSGPSATTLTTTGDMIVGVLGTGTVNQSGGSVSVGGNLTLGLIGTTPEPTGTYNLTGGTLSASNEYIGSFGQGRFIQNGLGTTNTVAGDLQIGVGTILSDTTRNGYYELDSGTLSTNNTIVGVAGLGTFTQYGGTHNVADTLTVGQQYTSPSQQQSLLIGGASSGTYDMYGGILNATNGIILGGAAADQTNFTPDSTPGAMDVAGGNGVFNHTSGSVTSGTAQVSGGAAGVEGDVIIGAQGPGQGTYNLGDSTNGAPSLTVNGSIIIGRDAGSNPLTTPGASPTNANLVIKGDGTNLSVFYNGGAGNTNPLSSDIMVGLNGNGSVTQQDKSAVYMDGDLSIGVNQGAVGSYSLNATSLESGYNLWVGNFLNIGGVGGYVNGVSEQNSPTGGTGYFTQASGDVNVVGAVYIGNNGGTGTYTMTGGTLTANLLDIGTNGGTGTFSLSGGTATVNGLRNAGTVDLNSNGTLALNGGGEYDNTSTGMVNMAGGTISGLTGTEVLTNEGAISGNGSISNLFALENTGTITPTGGTLTITPATGGWFQNDGAVTVGSGDTLAVTGPSGTTLIGITATGSLTVNGGTWTNSGFVQVGVGSGMTGTVTIENGGTASENSVGVGLDVGFQPGSSGTVTVTGAGSSWTDSNPSGGMIVGDSGTGIFDVENGGVANTHFAVFGGNGTTTGNGTLTVNGAGSQFNDSGYLTIGASGPGTLNITNGGTVSVGNDLDMGINPGSTGTATINNGQLNITGFVTVGGNDFTLGGGNATLLVEAGSAVTATGDLYLATGIGSSGTLTLTGAGTTWMNTGQQVLVGGSGNGTLNVLNGAVLSSVAGSSPTGSAGVVGYGFYTPTATGTATVDGAGSQWNLNGGGLIVGEYGTGTSSLTISNGGLVTGGIGTIGYDNTGNSIVTVESAGQWTMTGDLYVGGRTLNSTTGVGSGTLNVTSGGTVTDVNAVLAFSTGSTGTVTVTGANSQWNNSGSLTIGDAGTGSLTVTNNATVTAGGALTVGPNGTLTDNATVKVGTTTPTGTATNAGTVTIGSKGTMTLLSGWTYVQTGGSTQVDGSLTVPILNLNGGLLSGTGAIGSLAAPAMVMNNAGIVKGGDSPGTLNIIGNYTQALNGTLLTQIAGTGPGNYGVLDISGSAALDGTLDISLLNGFTPTAGETFVILDSSALSGTFSTVDGGNLCRRILRCLLQPAGLRKRRGPRSDVQWAASRARGIDPDSAGFRPGCADVDCTTQSAREPVAQNP